jgi:ubiquitin-activating enzyme E1
MAFSSPIESPKLDVCDLSSQTDKQFKKMDKIWDRFDVHGDITLQQFLDYFQNEKGLSITMLSCGVTLLYNSFFARKQANRLPMRLRELVEFVSKKPIAPHQKDLIFEICADDEEGEDVEVPFVRVNLRA